MKCMLLAILGTLRVGCKVSIVNFIECQGDGKIEIRLEVESSVLKCYIISGRYDIGGYSSRVTSKMDQPDNYTITGSLIGGGNGKRGNELVRILSFNEGKKK